MIRDSIGEQFDKLYQLLALEYNCSPADFKCQENVLTVSKLQEGRRIYAPDIGFLKFPICYRWRGN